METSPEQIARSSAHAERLSRETGVRTQIVGWYHSHPHITVLPSHVDVRTQVTWCPSAGGQTGGLALTAYLIHHKLVHSAALSPQAMYQLLDEHFIGLIFSVFNSDAASKAGRVQVGAFQTLRQGLIVHTLCPYIQTTHADMHVIACTQVTAFQSVPAGSSGAAPSGLAALGSEELVGLDSPTVAAMRASAGRKWGIYLNQACGGWPSKSEGYRSRATDHC